MLLSYAVMLSLLAFIYGQESDTQAACIDSDVKFSWNQDVYNCKQLVRADRCKCRDRVNSGGVSSLISDKCCASCSKSELSRCDCRDRPLQLGNGQTTCEKVISDWPDLCKRLGHGPDPPCCKTCSTLKCYDTKMTTWVSKKGKALHCPELIAENVCHCLKVKEDCCVSCKGHKSQGLYYDCCVDNPDYKTSIPAKYIHQIKQTISCIDCGCDDIYQLGSFFARKMCRKSSILKNCCDMCARVKTAPKQ